MDIDLKQMYEKALDALRKDLTHISFEVVKGKLKPALAKDLATYVKLLAEANKEQSKQETEEEDALSKLSNEELHERAKDFLKDS